MLKTLLTILLLILTVQNISAKVYSIAICQSMQHPSLDDVCNGFIEYLKSQSEEVRFKIFQNLNANILDKQKIQETITELSEVKYDLLFCIGTPAAKVCLKKVKGKNIIFSAVTDPLGVGLVQSMQRPGENISGMTDMSPLNRQLQLIKQIQPQCQNLGAIYSTDEQNSLKIIEILSKECHVLGLELKKLAIKKGEKVQERIDGIIKDCDALYVPTDNRVVSDLDQVVNLCLKEKVPLYSADPNSVSRGALAALTVDYFQMGLESAGMALELLRGANPAEMPVRQLEDMYISLNLKSAELTGLDIPVSLILAADVVYEDLKF